MQMRSNCAHAYLVAEVAYCDIEHAHVAELIEEDIHFGLEMSDIESGGVMIYAYLILAGRLNADNRSGLAVGDYLVGAALRLGLILCKGHDSHGYRIFFKLIYRIIEMKSDNCGHSLDRGDVLLLADDNGLCAERYDERTREQDGADNTVRLGTARRGQNKAGHYIYEVILLQCIAELCRGIHAERSACIFARGGIEDMANAVASGVNVGDIVEAVSEIENSKLFLRHTAPLPQTVVASINSLTRYF